MKGTYRTGRKTGKPKGQTNFDDWSDPLLRLRKYTTTKKQHLTGYEIKERLDKFKNKTGYCQTESDIDNICLMIKQGEPLLHHKEVRQLRLPLFTGLVLNLRDDGYPATSEYIKDLVVLDDMFSKHDRNRSLLRSSRIVLSKLAEGLKLAEEAKRKGNTTGEMQALMDLALFFMSTESSFYWLIEELMEQSISLLKKPQSPVDPKVEATLRYVYSSFLLDMAHDLVKAKTQLKLSMELSRGKNFWMINVDKKGENLLYLQSCALLSRINLEEAYEHKVLDIEKAIASCRESLLWAKQANDKPAIARVLLTLAMFYLDGNKLPPVLDILEAHIKLCRDNMFDRDLCEGYILLSKYHGTVGNNNKVAEVIEELLTFAVGKGILDIVMKAHINLAIIYGTQRIEKMKYHAAAAFKYCKLVGRSEDIELAGSIVGIAQGQPLLGDYVQLLLQSERSNSDEFKTLIGWKMLRIPFFCGDKTILYQPGIENNCRLKHEFEQVRLEETNFKHEEKLQKVSNRSQSTRISIAQHYGTKYSIVYAGESSAIVPEPSVKTDTISDRTHQPVVSFQYNALKH